MTSTSTRITPRITLQRGTGPWNPEELNQVVEFARRRGEEPNLLFLGRREWSALEKHLRGLEEAGAKRLNPNLLTYAGLKVMTVDRESYLRVAQGIKTVAESDPKARDRAADYNAFSGVHFGLHWEGMS